jgi:hypothetical protein
LVYHHYVEHHKHSLYHQKGQPITREYIPCEAKESPPTANNDGNLAEKATVVTPAGV